MKSSSTLHWLRHAALVSVAFWTLPNVSALAQLPEVQAAPQTVPEQAFPEQPIAAQSELPSSFTAEFSAANYVLGPGDQIAITVFGYEEFTGSRAVLPDGTIPMPLIGSVQASGQTLDSLAQNLTAQLSPYLVNPVVDVSLTVLRPIVVNVAGEVYRPGPIQLSSLTDVSTRVGTDARITSSSNTPTLAAALTAAGGVRQDADIRRVVLQRPGAGGRAETVTINLWDSLWSDTTPDNIILRDGDSIFVPEVTEQDGIDPRLIARSSFAPETIRVRVVGEVKSPGEVLVPPNSSLSSAVAIAGGPTEDAELDETRLVRLSDAGEIEEEKIDLQNLIDDYQVRDGDVIFVPKENVRSVIDFASRLFNPLRFILDIFR